MCMLAYTFYESDNRVRRYADSLFRRGNHVDVISLRKPDQPNLGTIDGVTVYRIQKRKINEKNKITYLYRLFVFFFNSLFLVTKLHLRKKYAIIHVHSVPDYEVFAAIFAKILGAKVILDIHDIVPEFYASKFNSGKITFLSKVLMVIEKICCSFSDHVIISNHLWYDKLVSRSVKPEKCTTIINYPDEHLFNVGISKEKSDKFTIIYPGTINHHQGLDIAIGAMDKISDSVSNVEFHIYGKGPEEENIRAMVKARSLEKSVKLLGLLPLEQIAVKMASAQLGLVPKRADSFGNEAFSTKIMEFMALGVPVLISRTRIDEYYFNDSLVMFFQSGNENDLAEKLLFLINNQDVRERYIQKELEFAAKNSWAVRQSMYFDEVDRLIGKKR